MALTTGGARRGPEQLLLSGIAAGRLSRTFGEASVAEQPSTLNGHRFMVIESDTLELMITGGNRGNGGVAAKGGNRRGELMGRRVRKGSIWRAGPLWRKYPTAKTRIVKFEKKGRLLRDETRNRFDQTFQQR
jgi:hypothetical protein